MNRFLRLPPTSVVRGQTEGCRERLCLLPALRAFFAVSLIHGRSRIWWILILAAAAFFPQPNSLAHGLGAARVKVLFSKGGTYRAEVELDLRHATSGIGPAPGFTDLHSQEVSRRVARRYGRLLRDFTNGMILLFDSRQVQPRLEKVRSMTESGLESELPPWKFLHLRYSGKIPAGAGEFQWGQTLALGQVSLSLRHEGQEDPDVQWLQEGAMSPPFPLNRDYVPPTFLGTVGRYLVLGFTHILPLGIDHILFVLALFLLSLEWRPLLAQVTAFTLAHTVTLATSTLGIASLPPRIVEPLIAISIVTIAVENLLTERLARHRIGVVFGFGLLHGMGFATVLRHLGLPSSQLAAALVSFNVGVEIGQLAVLTLAFLAVGLWFRHKQWYRRAIVLPGSVGIALCGLYWTVQRIFFV